MRLLTKGQRDALLKNGRTMAQVDISTGVYPVVKLFTPDARATWLLAWIEPWDEDVAWGLCDLGAGFPELGPVRLSELRAVRGPLGLRVERDTSWDAEMTLLEYARKAAAAGRVVA